MGACSTMAYKQKMPTKVPEGDNLFSLVRARPPPVSQGIAPLLNNMSIFFHFILIQIHIDKGFLSTFGVILSTTCLGSKDVAVVRKQLTSFNVARAQILAATPNVGLVCCWFSFLLRGVFLQVLQFFPLVKKQLFQIPIRPGTHGRMS